MKRKQKQHLLFFIILIFIVLLPTAAKAQAWLTAYVEYSAGIESQAFAHIRQAFYTEMRQINRQPNGWKQFKRWEYFMNQRIAHSGLFPRNALMKAYQQRLASAKDEPLPPHWAYSGADTIPVQSGNGRINCLVFHPTDAQTMWAGAATGGLWQTTDGGRTWHDLAPQLPSLGISDMVLHPKSPDTLLIATGDADGLDTYSAGIFQFVNGQNGWTAITNYELSDQIVVNKILINKTVTTNWVIATNQGIWQSHNNGHSWQLVQTGNFIDLIQHPENTSTYYATTFGNARIYKSLNAGQSFQELSTGIPPTKVNRIKLAVTPAAPSSIYALCSSAANSGFYGFYRSWDEGENWTEMYPGNEKNLLGWSATGSDTGGQGWYDLALAVSPVDENSVCAGGINVWQSNNGGLSWQLNTHWTQNAVVDRVHADHHFLGFHPLTRELYSGNDGGVHRRNPHGHWNDLSSNLQITQIYRIGTAATNENIVLCGTQDNGTQQKSYGVWREVLGGDGMECLIDPANASIQYAEYYFGNLYKSVTGGSRFSSIHPNPADTGAWITPVVMQPGNSQVLYAAYSQLYKTTDGGNNWQSISPVLAPHKKLVALALCESDENTIYVAAPDSLWRTTDGGTTWTNISAGLPSATITYIATSNTNAEKLWVTFSGFSAAGNGLYNKVYASDNAGETWHNYSDGLPAVPANCIVYHRHSDDALYVGTDLGVYYRNSRLPQWQFVGQGMPNVIVNELEIHYGSRRLYAGTYGRGLWKSPVNPVADFAADKEDYIENETITLTCQSYTGIEQRQWRFETLPQFVSYNADSSEVELVYAEVGECSVNLTVSAGGVASSIQKTLTVKPDNHLDVYPNPARDVLNVEFRRSAFTGTPALVKLHNAHGQLLYETTTLVENPVHRFTISVSGMARGVYFLEVRHEGQVFSKKIAIQ